MTRNGANGTQNYLVNPPRYAALLTPGQCQLAENIEAGEDPADAGSFAKEAAQCVDFAKDAGEPVAYNETLVFVSALVELSRALDTSFYGPNAAEKVLAEQTFPEIAARAMRYYESALGEVGSCTYELCNGHYQWNYSGDPAFPSHPDDTEHATVEMFAMGLMWRNESRLDTLLAADPNGADEIRLGVTDMRLFANTFLERVVGASHLYEDQSERVPSPIDSYDGDTEGWADLTAFNPDVLDQAAAVTLAPWNPAIDVVSTNDYGSVTLQPHLTIGNHAALIAAKAAPAVRE